MPIVNPTQLVDEFKKSGEFDRLRRELLKQFQQSEGMDAFIARVEDIARQRLTSDQKLQYMAPEVVHRELMQEIDRFPLVERAVGDVRILSDSDLASSMRGSLQRILRKDRKKTELPQVTEGIRDDAQLKTNETPKAPTSMAPPMSKMDSAPYAATASPLVPSLMEVTTVETMSRTLCAESPSRPSRPGILLNGISEVEASPS